MKQQIKISAPIVRVSLLLAAGLRLWAQDSAYLMTRDYVIVEAEDLPRSSNWRFSTVDTYTGSYTGRGYVRWDGPNQSCAALGKPEDEWHNDITGACQGSSRDWLRVPVYIERIGTYVMDIHNLHLMEDGDNDVWTHIEGWPVPVYRVGSHHPEAFGWLSWGPPEFSSWQIREVPRVYTFYVAGRSPGFCVDRIAIYRKIGPNDYPPQAHDLSTPPSTMSSLVSRVGASVCTFSSRDHITGVEGTQVAVDMRGRRHSGVTRGTVFLYCVRSHGLVASAVRQP